MRSSAVLLVGLGLLLSAGCVIEGEGLDGPTVTSRPAGAPGVVPYASSSPGPEPGHEETRFTNALAPASVPDCTAAQLVARGVFQAAGQGQQDTVAVDVVRRGTGSCAFGGARTGASVLAATTDRVLLPGGRSPDVQPRLLLEPGAQSRVFLAWTTACGAPASVRVRLTVLTEPPLVLVATPTRPVRCRTGRGVPRPYTTRTVSYPVVQDPPADTAAVTSAITSASSRGTRLQLVVRLTNPTRGPVALRPCPTYVLLVRQVDQLADETQELGGTRQRLNCAAAPELLAAGAHLDVRLELEAALPRAVTSAGPVDRMSDAVRVQAEFFLEGSVPPTSFAEASLLTG